MRRTIVLLIAASSLAAEGPLDLDGIAHVAFRVSDVAASREFYGKLGFEQVFEFSDANGTTTSYLKVNDRQFIELYRRTAAEPIGLMHLCFDVQDIERLREAYAGHGLEAKAPAKARAGNLLFNLRDPEDQVLEYTQYLPGSLHWKARGTPPKHVSGHLVAATVAVKDPAAERAFYAARLGFEDLGGADTIRLRVPGRSREEVQLEAAAPEWKPRVVVAVPDLGRTVAALKERGLAVETRGSKAQIADPDGVTIVFTLEPAALEILELERHALEGWLGGDPDPSLALLDADATYFHAMTTHRLDSAAAVRALFEGYRGTALFDAFEIQNPRVQMAGDAGVLTYVLVRHNGAAVSRWNATQVYRHNPDGWRVLHTHFSQIPQPAK
ncbi:MAG: VOC family protein [Acidobacteriia bacterium]|nr:VOC family protein [Terriglobia bacterium]